MACFDSTDAAGIEALNNIASVPDFNYAHAYAYYSCKYFESVKENADKNLAIALINQLIATYFADKQYEIAKQEQDRLNDISDEQLAQARMMRDHWNNNFRACEAATINAACAYVDEVPDYTALQARADADVESAFAAARNQIDQCIPLHCVGARCDAFRRLDLQIANAKVLLRTQSYRKEEERVRMVNASYYDRKVQMLGVGRGVLELSSSAFNSAAQIAQAAGQINPYEGFQNVVNGVAQAFVNNNNATTMAQGAMLGNMSNMYSPAQTNSQPSYGNTNSTMYNSGISDGTFNMGSVDYMSSSSNGTMMTQNGGMTGTQSTPAYMPTAGTASPAL